MRSRFPRTRIPLFTKIVGKVIEKEDVEGEMGDVAVRVCTMHMDSRTPWTALWLLPKGAIPTLSYSIVLSPFLHCAICTAQSERECALCNARRRVHHCTEEGTGAGTGAPSCGKWAIMCIWQYLGNPFTLLPRVARSQDWRAPEISLKDIFCEKDFSQVTGELTDLKATLGNVQSSLTSSLASIQGDISWI